MILHDFRCQCCGLVVDEIPVESGTTELPCPACENGVMGLTYSKWRGLGLVNAGRSVDDRIGADGTITMLGATDSKLCHIELGLTAPSPHNKSLKTFTPEQSAEFRRRAMLDGKSARVDRKLFDAIIAQRKENIKAGEQRAIASLNRGAGET